MNIYFGSLISSWIGWILLLMASLVFTAILCLMVFKFSGNKSETIESQKKLCIMILKLSRAISPSLGLLGTVYGLLKGFMKTSSEELPRIMGMALTTTFVGVSLFLISFFVLFIINYKEDG